VLLNFDASLILVQRISYVTALQDMSSKSERALWINERETKKVRVASKQNELENIHSVFMA